MMKLFLRTAIMAVCVVVMSACEKGGDTAPKITVPQLTAPVNNSVDNVIMPTFTWAKSTGSNVRYELLLSSDQGQSWVSVVSNLTANTYTLTTAQKLKRRTTYKWMVKASSGSTNKESEQYLFSTTNLPTVDLAYPGNGGQTLTAPQLRWGMTSLNSNNRSSVTYSLKIKVSTDADWTTVVNGLTQPNYNFTGAELGKTYNWQVTAVDDCSGESVSGISTFKYQGGYADGDYMLYKDSNLPPGYNPSIIVVMGDGFVEQDYMFGGYFDQKIDYVLDEFFKVEPFKTYKDYYKVYKVAAVSADRGLSVVGPRPENPAAGRPALGTQTKNTALKIKLREGTTTAMDIVNSLNNNPIFDYAYKVPGVDANTRSKVAILVVANINSWSGCAYLWPSGESIAITALDDEYVYRMVHEAGHGIAKLGDEYVNLENYSKMTPETDKQRPDGLGVWEWRGNVDYTGNMATVHWKHYFDIPGYDVGLYEGAHYYGLGAWRPSYNSIMNNHVRPIWFNAPSREALVRRVMFVANQPFDFNDFLAKDVEVKASLTRGSVFDMYGPSLDNTPPIIMDGSR